MEQPGQDAGPEASRVHKGPACWEWTGSLRGGSSKGRRTRYGGFTRGKVRVYAHRFAWELAHGPVPAGLWVLHHCDNPRCVRPDHLFLGDHHDNMRDMMAKGRHYSPALRGEQHGQAKLSEAQVREIRQLAGTMGMEQIARRYGVSGSIVALIIKRRRWTYLP
jgi:hypothetical protein